MRVRAAALLTMLFLASLPVASGVEVQAGIVQDDEGDVMLRTADGSDLQGDGEQFPNVDLTSAGIWAEDDETVTVFIQVADLGDSSQNPVPFSDPDYELHFDHGQQGYRVLIITALQNAVNDAMGRSGTVFARLQQETAPGRYESVADLEAEIDTSQDMVRAVLPRGAIVDHNQAPLGRNATLEQVWASARSMGQFAFPVGQTGPGGDPVAYAGMPMAYDQAPDALEGVLPSYTMTTGAVKQRGGLYAVSEDPIRWTNGEATTIAYQVRLTNTAGDDVPVSAEVRGAPSAWTVAYSDALEVPAQGAINATVLVTIPFGHNHGLLQMFEAAYESNDGSHLGIADLGVYWPEVPQPAGHHDQLWVHATTEEDDGGFFPDLQGGLHGWMSAKEDEERADGSNIPAMFSSPAGFPPGTGNAIGYWQVQLEPELRMGIDMRPEEAGSAEITLDLPVQAVDPQVSVYLQHGTIATDRRGGTHLQDQVTLASGVSEPLAGGVSGTQTFVVELEISDDADLIPYAGDRNLALIVVLEATAMAGGGFLNPEEVTPSLVPGATWMQLPLNEYVDALDNGFQTSGNLELIAGPEGQQRAVNPGRTTVYTFELRQTGLDGVPLEASITGSNVEWAQIVGDTEFTLGPDEARTLALAVEAPDRASQGERADLTITVTAGGNAALQAGLNVLTIVDTDNEIPDERDRIEELDDELSAKKESPGIGVVLLLAAFLLLARRRR